MLKITLSEADQRHMFLSILYKKNSIMLSKKVKIAYINIIYGTTLMILKKKTLMHFKSLKKN